MRIRGEVGQQLAAASLLLLVSLVGVAQALTVLVPGLGAIQGTSSLTAWTHRTVHEFRGVRYAQSPSGDLRFKEPVKALPWSGTLDATQFGQICPQPGDFSSEVRSSRSSYFRADPEVEMMQTRAAARAKDYEDCLTLDVHTPTDKATAKLPVLVYFHGGAFLYGSSAAQRPGFLLESDIVMVCPQYRLGVLGFFHLNTIDAPGNMGLVDQLMALQWVHDNIAAFGGDPTRVTIAGISAGGASVSLHMLSPRSKGLFHQVVAQSGSAIAQWSINEKDGEEQSRAVAKFAQCDYTAPAADLAACMRNVTVQNTMNAFLYYTMLERRAGNLGLGASQPVLQREAAGVKPFISERPRVTLEAGRYEPLPLLMGVTRHEGLYFLDITYQYYLVPNNLTQDINYMQNEIIPNLLETFGVTDNTRVVADAMTKRYLNPNDIGNFTKMTPGLVDFTGAMMMKGPSVRQAELHARHASTYFYTFDHYGQYTEQYNDSASLPVPGGVTHGDDNLYLFQRQSYPLNVRDTVIAQRFTKLFTNFVISGKPNPAHACVPGVPTWPAFRPAVQSYLSIGVKAAVHRDVSTTFTVARTQGLAAPRPGTRAYSGLGPA